MKLCVEFHDVVNNWRMVELQNTISVAINVDQRCDIHNREIASLCLVEALAKQALRYV